MSPRRIPIIELALAAMALRAIAHYAEPIVDAVFPKSHEDIPNPIP